MRSHQIDADTVAQSVAHPESAALTLRYSQPTTPQRAAASAVFGIRELVWGWRAALRASRKQLAMQPGECLGRSVIRAQPEDDASPRLDQPACQVDQLLHHRFDAPSLGRVAYRRVWPEQPALAHQAQDVHRQRRQLAHQRIGCLLYTSPSPRD